MARILVIDDDPNICTLISSILRRQGHEVEVHLDGRRALRAFQDKGADLVVTDVYMPEGDGIELLLELDAIAPETPVIVMSGGGIASIESVLTDARFFGAVSTLEKPIDVDVLLATVAAALSKGPPGGGEGAEQRAG